MYKAKYSRDTTYNIRRGVSLKTNVSINTIISQSVFFFFFFFFDNWISYPRRGSQPGNDNDALFSILSWDTGKRKQKAVAVF